MEKFCTNCGKDFKGEEKFCMQCGTKRSEDTDVNNTYNAEQQVVKEKPFTQAIHQAQESNTKGKSKAKLVAIISTIALVIVVAVVALLLINPFGGEGGNSEDDKASSYTKPLELCEDLLNGDISVLEDMVPEAVWEDLEDDGKSFEDYKKQVKKKLEAYEENYGSNVEFSFEILDEDKLTAVQLDGFKGDGLYNISNKSITEAITLEVEWKIEGDDIKQSSSEVLVVKIDGEWYLMGLTGFFVALTL